jgi:hypothetical protein
MNLIDNGQCCVITVYFKTHTEDIRVNAFCMQSANTVNVKAGGTNSYWYLKD